MPNEDKDKATGIEPNAENNPIAGETEAIDKPAAISQKQRGRPFQKGTSGNPSGRPKTSPEMKNALELLRSYAPEASKCLVEIMKSKTARSADRVRAAEIIMDRTYGKAPATVNVDMTNNDVANEIRNELKSIREQYAEEQKRPDQDA